LRNDGDEVPEALRKTQKMLLLDIMLGQIASYCPIIARNTITNRANSLNEIWQIIRHHLLYVLYVCLVNIFQVSGVISETTRGNFPYKRQRALLEDPESGTELELTA
jgi:hypothetical protein